MCPPGTWGQPSVGCAPCLCSAVGSTGPNCELGSGQCSCRPEYTGHKCNICPGGHVQKYGQLYGNTGSFTEIRGVVQENGELYRNMGSCKEIRGVVQKHRKLYRSTMRDVRKYGELYRNTVRDRSYLGTGEKV